MENSKPDFYEEYDDFEKKLYKYSINCLCIIDDFDIYRSVLRACLRQLYIGGHIDLSFYTLLVKRYHINIVNFIMLFLFTNDKISLDQHRHLQTL